MADEQGIRMAMLNGGKTERIIFAVTPELKETVTALARRRGQSVSAYISSLIVDDVVKNREVLDDELE